MLKKVLAGAALLAATMSAQAGALLTENFEDVSTLAGKGWILTNASIPAGETSGWAQGSAGVFQAFKGTGNSYVSANYTNAAAGGQLDSWLITPEFSIDLGAIVSFWARADAFDGYSDQISYGFSTSGAALESFTMMPTVTVGTNGWAMYQARIKGQGDARFAIRYSGEADLSNYVGVDQFGVAAIPEPSSMAILFAGAMGLMMSRRRKRG